MKKTTKKKKVLKPKDELTIIWENIRNENTIPMCLNWSKYDNFKSWSNDNGYREGLELKLGTGKTIYKPDNCSWEEPDINNYKKNTILLKYKGRTQSLKEWCEELKLDYHATYARLYRLHYPIKEAFEIEVQR